MITLDKTQHAEGVLAENILSNSLIYTLRETDEFCLYNGGVFHNNKEALVDIRTIITNICKEACYINEDKTGNISTNMYKATISKRNQILEEIKTKTFLSLDEFDVREDVICCLNGKCYLDKLDYNDFLKSGFVSHFKFNENPYKTFIQIPVKYNSNAKCPEIEKFLTEIFGYERLPFIYETISYLIVPTIKYQKAFMIYGVPSSGKTSFINLIVQFIGGNHPERIISQIKLQDLRKRFTLANLKDKLFNYYDDLNYNKLANSDAFRLVVTNKYLSSEIKNVQGYITWRNYCKQLYSCNYLPEIPKNTGDEFWRRWLLIQCFNEFTPEKKRLEFANKKWSQEELSGLLNKCIEAWFRLENRQKFPEEYDNIETLKGTWMIDVNPVKLFVTEKCSIGEYFEINDKLFLNECNKFREEHQAKPITLAMCTHCIQEISDKIEKRKKGDGSWVYKGVKLNYDVLDEEEKSEYKKIDEYNYEANKLVNEFDKIIKK